MSNAHTLHGNGPDAADLARPGFWISPDGRIIRIDRHINYVWEHPESFGFTREEIQNIYREFNEQPGLEGQSRGKIIRIAVSRNWIRIRRYHWGWSFNIPEYSNPICLSLTRFAQEILSTGIAGVRELDEYQRVTITTFPDNHQNSDYEIGDISQGCLQPSHENTDTPSENPGEGSSPGPSLLRYSEIRSRYPAIDRCFNKMESSLLDTVHSLSESRDLFLAELKKNDIDHFIFTSYIVEKFVSGVLEMRNVTTYRRMTTDMFIRFVGVVEEIEESSPI